MIIEKLIDILTEFKDFDRSTVNRDTTFESLGLDSLDVVDFVMKIEDAFGVAIPMDKEMLKTIGNVEDFISQNK